MRIDKPYTTLAVAVFLAFTLVAFGAPDAFKGVVDQGGLGLALALFIAGCGAALRLDIPALGPNAHVSLPLFLALAAPYALRTFALDALLAWLRRPAAPPAQARPYPTNAPAALPPRLAVALVAAGRARR